MKKILILSFLFLSACGYANYSEVVNHSGYTYTAMAESESRLGDNSGAWGGSYNSQSEANYMAIDYCKTRYSDCVLTFEGGTKVYSGEYVSRTVSSSYNTSSSYNYGSSNNNQAQKYYSNSRPVLFYDNSSNSMKECAGQVIAGTCSRYAPYNASSYDYDTLFYNPSTGAMQRCANHSLGRCLSFRPQPVMASNDQLFYNPRTRSMSTCLNSNRKGQCLAFGITPTASTNNQRSGTYIVDDPSNPYYKKVPQTSLDLINLGNSMLSGNCTLGLNC